MQVIVRRSLRGSGAMVLRTIAALTFLTRGASKCPWVQGCGLAAIMEDLGTTVPTLAAVALMLVELLGGAAPILGLPTRSATVPLTVGMPVPTPPVHLPNGFFARDSGVECTLLLAVACVGWWQ